MTTDIPTELDEALDAEAEILTTMEQLAHVRADLETFMAEMARLQTWIETNVGADAQLGDNPVDLALRTIAKQRLAIAHLQADGEYIATALRNEAEERSWCDEYEGFVDRVNDGLQEMSLIPCRRNHDVELRIYASVRCAADDLEDQRQALRGEVLKVVQDADGVVSVAVGIE